MKVKLTKVSTYVIGVVINSADPSITEGEISLVLSIGKDNSKTVMTLPYSNREVLYSFNLSKKLPRSLGDFYYIVSISDGSNTDATKKIGLFGNIPHHISGAIKKIRHDFGIIAKNYNGSEAYFFKKLKSEEVCPDCWDRDLRASSNSNCKTCGGTGYVTYFTNPYKTYCGEIKWSNETYKTEDPGKSMPTTTVSISALADLILTTDDIIYYVSTGDFFRVVSRTVSEMKGNPVLQTLVSNMIPSNFPDAEICKDLVIQRGLKL